MLAWATYLSVSLYLVPLLVLAAVRSRRGRETWEIGLDIPLGVAADLLGVLALARLVHLESAILISRPIWVLGGVAAVVRRRRAGRPWPAWPASIDWRVIARVGVCVALAVYLSMSLSRPCLNADRRWHIPLVASLRGQTVPFHNVYDPHGPLAYHYAGDVLAAELQTLSGDVLHASLALSLAHDLMFGLTAACLSLLFLHGRGRWKTVLVMAASLGFLLSGPITVWFAGKAVAGYSYINFLRLGFRPHTSMAALLLVGFLGAAWARLRDEPRRARGPGSRTWPVLFACTAALALTDEASVALLGLSLGVAWVVRPDVIHPRRLAGLGVLVALLAVLVGTMLVFAGSFSPGAPRQQVHLTPWRNPGYHNAPLLLKAPRGVEYLFRDTASLLVVWLAGAILVLRRRRRALGLLALFTTLVVVSWGLLLRVEVGPDSMEGHRFVTASMLATPLFGFWWILRARAPGDERVERALVALLAVASIASSAASTLFWRDVEAPRHCDSLRSIFTTEPLHDTDCRARLGVRFGETPRPEYVAKPLAYWYEGCHSVFAPTSKQLGQYWAVATGMPIFGYEALRTLHSTMLAAGEPLRATCPPGGLADDPVCTFALAKGGCTRVNPEVVTCTLSAADRAAILAREPRVK